MSMEPDREPIDPLRLFLILAACWAIGIIVSLALASYCQWPVGR